MKPSALILITFFLPLFIGCNSELPLSERAHIVHPGSKIAEYAYWHTVKRDCRVADTGSRASTKYAWTGLCVDGLVSGCGTLFINPNTQYEHYAKGCFVKGIRRGEFDEGKTSDDTVSRYFYDEKGVSKLVTFDVERDQQLKASALRREAEFEAAKKRKIIAEKERALSEAARMEKLKNLTSEMMTEIAGSAGSGTRPASSASGPLIWPTEGGMEQWGFERPKCSTGYDYERPWLKKIEAAYINGETQFSKAIGSSTYFESAPAKAFAGNPASAVVLQRDLISIQRDITLTYKTAADYLKIISSGARNKKEVVDGFRSFATKQNCASTASTGVSSSQALHCGVLYRLISITDRLENVAQFACRMGLNTPVYASTVAPSAPAPVVSSRKNQERATSAAPVAPAMKNKKTNDCKPSSNREVVCTAR